MLPGATSHCALELSAKIFKRKSKLTGSLHQKNENQHEHSGLTAGAKETFEPGKKTAGTVA